MRILIATYSRALLGGVEKYLQSVIPGLIGRGHSLALVYELPPSDGEQRIDAPSARLPAWCLKELGVDAVLRSVANWKPDLVYSNGLDDSALEAALLERYPAILYAHTYIGTCVTGRKCYASPRIEPCSRQLGASCLLYYYPRRCGGLNPRTMWQLFQVQSNRKSRLPEYQAVLVASHHMYHEYQRNGVNPSRLQLVPLFATDTVALASPPMGKEITGRILFIGRLMDVKGVDYLLEAVSAAAGQLGRALSLTVAGDGPDRAELREKARKLGVAVEFAGWVDAEKKLELMRQADLLAVPSLWPEPFGLAGIEAASVGLPAVGFAVGGISDWLIPGESGEIAPGDPPTVAGLTGAIVRALADPSHYQKLSRGAWKVATEFSLDRHLGQLEQILKLGAAATQLIPTAV